MSNGLWDLNPSLLQTLSTKPIFFYFTRVKFNRICSGLGQTKNFMVRIGAETSDLCDCGHPLSIDHLFYVAFTKALMARRVWRLMTTQYVVEESRCAALRISNEQRLEPAPENTQGQMEHVCLLLSKPPTNFIFHLYQWGVWGGQCSKMKVT